MFTGLSAPTKCEVDEVDAGGVDDGEGLGTTLGRRAYVGRMVAELEDVASVPERGLFEVRTIPLLCFLTCQNNV